MYVGIFVKVSENVVLHYTCTGANFNSNIVFKYVRLLFQHFGCVAFYRPCTFLTTSAEQCPFLSIKTVQLLTLNFKNVQRSLVSTSCSFGFLFFFCRRPLLERICANIDTRGAQAFPAKLKKKNLKCMFSSYAKARPFRSI